MSNEIKLTAKEWYFEITSKRKHTAVEYYAIEICELMRNQYGEGIIDLDVLKKAKEMEKEQIIKAIDSNYTYNDNQILTIGEQYYKKTFE
jgi:cytochrome c-type biogenesis protein CcmE